MGRRALAVVPAVVLGVCLYVVKLPVFVVSPGPADDALALVDIDGTDTYDPEGRLLFTTVYAGGANLYDAIKAWFDPEASVDPEWYYLTPGVTEQEYDELQLSAMDQSKLAAAAAGLSEITEYPELHGAGAIIEGVLPGTPADGKLFPGDLVVTAAGREVMSVDDLLQAVHQAGVNGQLTLEVHPVEGGEIRRVVVRPTFIDGGLDIGVHPIENFPFDVRIDSGQIGGPSAGFMWSLAIVDLLTPGDLTEGRTVAGTGTIDDDGNVGPIGSVIEKAIAAERAGAEVFLVPSVNLEEALAAPVDMEIVPVDTLDDALRHLSS